MDKQTFLWESLVAYINTHEYLIWSTSGVCSLIFVTSVVLLTKKLGVLGNNPSVRFSWPSLLVVTILLCIGTFISNYFIYANIGDFFSTLYQQKKIQDFCYMWEANGKVPIDKIVKYFGGVREEVLTPLSLTSLLGCVLSSICISIWFILNSRIWLFLRSKLSKKRNTK